jgi:arylsulfatase A-like enzyme
MQSISTAPNTPPSHSSLFTGLYPSKHGIRSFFHRRLPDDANTVFEILGDAGYTSLAVGDQTLFHDILGMTRGVDHFIHHSEGDDVLFENLAGHADEDVFLFHRFTDVHFPYFVTHSPPEENYLKESYEEAKQLCDRFGFEFVLEEGDYNDVEAHTQQWFTIKNALTGKRGIAEVLVPAYVRGVSWFDAGRFDYYMDRLGELGVLDDALVVLTADHGESVIRADKVEDGVRRFDHCNANVDDLVRTPLIFHAPGRLQPTTVDAQVSIVDILPTILDIVGVDEPESGYDIQGQSLLPVIEGEKSKGSTAYSEHAWWNDGRFDDAEGFMKRFYSEGKILDYEALPRYRSVRTPEYRYVELGEDVTSEDLNTDTEMFVRTLYRKVRVDWPNNHEDEIERLTSELESGTLDRDTVLDQFMQKAILSNRYALYDLETDPYEEVNLLLVDEKRFGDCAERMRSELTRIYNNTEDHDDESLILDDVDTDEFIKNLEDLGYI